MDHFFRFWTQVHDILVGHAPCRPPVWYLSLIAICSKINVRAQPQYDRRVAGAQGRVHDLEVGGDGGCGPSLASSVAIIAACKNPPLPWAEGIWRRASTMMVSWRGVNDG